MDILKPDLVWIENRCYRKLNLQSGEKTVFQEDELYPSQSHGYTPIEDDVEKFDDLPIQHDGDKFYVSISIPGPLMGYVLGKDKKNIRRIQESTGSQIKIPSMYGNEPSRGKNFSRTEKSKDIVITATKNHSVAEAFKSIKRIIDGGRWKICDYTHFVSLPVNNHAIQEGFKKFQRDVITNFKSVRGIKEALFESPAKLHLTIVMLTLLDDGEKEIAKSVLNKCKNDVIKILDGKPLKLEIKGVEYMNDDPSEVNVLYGKVQESDNNNLLQIIAQKISDAFVDVNLALNEHDFVKLHVTLMKSKRENEKRSSFDARPLLEKYNDFLFGETDISEIHISTRFTGGDGKYYTPSAIITL